jgi:hypothetical protein
MNEHVEEYLRRIHQAGGVPTKQAIDTTYASRAAAHWPLDSTPGGRFRSRPFHNAAVEAGRNVNHSVCLMP